MGKSKIQFRLKDAAEKNSLAKKKKAALDVLVDDDSDVVAELLGDILGMSHDGVLESGMAVTGWQLLHLGQASGKVLDGKLGQASVLLQGIHHELNGDVVVVRMPAVIISDEADGTVGDLSLLGELDLWHSSHADDRSSPGAIDVGFSLGREAWALNAYVGSSDVDLGVLDGLGDGLDRLADDGGEGGADGIGEGDVRDDSVAKERVIGSAMLGVVDILVGDADVSWTHFLLQRSASSERKNVFDSDGLEGPDVGPEGDLRWEESVSSVVAGDEGQADLAEGSQDDLAGWLSEWGGEVELDDVSQSIDVVDSGSSDNSNDSRILGHDATKNRL